MKLKEFPSSKDFNKSITYIVCPKNELAPWPAINLVQALLPLGESQINSITLNNTNTKGRVEIDASFDEMLMLLAKIRAEEDLLMELKIAERLFYFDKQELEVYSLLMLFSFFIAFFYSLISWKTGLLLIVLAILGGFSVYVCPNLLRIARIKWKLKKIQNLEIYDETK